MEDRLSQLKQSDEGSSSMENGLAGGEPVATKDDGAPFMADFFKEVGSIKASMAVIRRNIEKFEATYAKALSTVSQEGGQKSSAELDALVDETNAAAADCRNRLKKMDDENKANKDFTAAEARIRKNMHGTLTRKFMDLMQEYQEVQAKYKNKYRERVERQYKTVKPDASPEEIEEALESGNTHQIFADEILEHHAEAKQALAYIQQRHQDILKLEQSIQELHQLFLDMAILVETQGELIDQIEYNVSQSVAYTGEGVKQLQKANEYAKKARKKMCILIIILLIVGIVIAAPILGTQL